MIPASGHAWSVTFTWTSADENGAAATANCVCGNNPVHNKTVEATVETVGTTGAHCGQPGSVTYRASVTLDGTVFTSEDKIVNTDALAHIWNVTWSWNVDHTEATASFICERDGSHTGSETDYAPVETTVTPATCKGNKYVKYTAAVTFDGNTYTAETDPIEIPESNLGHDFGEWAQSKAPTCTEAGEEKRTCSRENCIAYETRTVEALGHTYAFAGWTWAEGYTSASAKFVCTVDGCGDTVFKTDSVPAETELRQADCEYDRVV